MNHPSRTKTPARRVVLGGALALTLALSACGSDTASEPATDGSKPYVAIVSKGFQHQFWQAVKTGADQAAEEFDVEVTFEGPDTEQDVDQQIQQLQTALDKNPDAIGFAALDTQAALPLLQQAQSADIPVIAFDSGVEGDIPVTTAATDNLAAAAEAAKHMVEAIGGSGKVAIVAHDQTSLTGQQRRDGFVDYIEKNAPDVQIVDIQYGAGDQAKSADITKAMLSADPDIKGVYGTNEGSAIGVVQGARELGFAAGAVTIIGFDSGKAQIDAIEEGYEFGAITQDPVGMGYDTVKAAVEAINGETLPKTIDTGFYWYDKTNITDEDIAAVLYQ